MKNFRIIVLTILIVVIVIWIIVEINKTSEGYLYGNSLRQNRIVNTIRLHKYGITGERITIGLIDAGFNTQLSVFANTKVIKEYDFVTQDSTTFNQKHLRGVDHGTNVLSVIGGYQVNELIGIAYGADFILAKTDISTDRLSEEEINAVKAARWLSDMGAKVITTSLSFNKFLDTDFYYPNQMNGVVSKITIVADSLVREGIVFCCSAGNNFESDWRIIEPPGDGFNVLTAGSIDKNLIHSFFSSCGPTADGRIKPDIVTPGEGVWNANYLPAFKPEFSWNHGTSLSAPIAAGIAALILSSHPDLSSFEVIDAIKKTSSKSNLPDSLYGYGVPDAEKAVTYYGPAFSNTPEFNFDGNELEIKTYVFSSYSLDKSSVVINLVESGKNYESEHKMEQVDDEYFSYSINLESDTKEVMFYFIARDERGYSTKYPTGIIGDKFVLNLVNGKINIH